MATIALYADKINQMPWLINDVKKSVTDYKSELSVIRAKSLNINKSICDLDDVISSIQTSTQTQEEKITSLDTFNQNHEKFVSEVVRIDGDVADVINKRKNDFYNQYYYLKPECEKNWREKAKDWLVSAGEWCKEHWKLIVTVVLVIAAVIAIIAITVFTAGAALGPILTVVIGACKGLIGGTLLGGLIGGLSSIAAGGSFWEGFEEGAFAGALTGALFGGLGGVGQLFGKAFGASCKIFNAVKYISFISGGISLGMAGFDLISLGAVLLFGQDNFLTALNTKLHSNSFYNAFQVGISALAVFSGSAYKTMKPIPRVCFVAGTMILTASGLVAIENIKAGDQVVAANVENWKNGEKTVLSTFASESNELTHIFVNGEKISATPIHLFYVVDKGWVSAANLSYGNILMLPAENHATVECVTSETLEKPVKVYNFEVDDWHNYFVSKVNILVHNKNEKIPWDLNSDKTIQQLLQGKGQITNLRKCGNVYNVSIDELLKKTPKQLVDMAKEGKITYKTLKQFKKPFEGRDLGGSKRGC